MMRILAELIIRGGKIKMLDLSYKEYLEKMNKKDARQSWIDWKIEICGMSEKEAIIAGHDPVWGWEEGLGE